MIGEYFKRFHATKKNRLEEKYRWLERQAECIWDEYCNWCYENPSGATPPIDYVNELEKIHFKMDNINFLLSN